MDKFTLTSKYQPTGDQPEAIRQLTDGLNNGDKAQVLLGVTGSGKTFTVANVIANVNRPTLVLSHNKTLAAQLYEEMKGFFPENAVEYYVSYYDYYQPEAYLPQTDTYIEKDRIIENTVYEVCFEIKLENYITNKEIIFWRYVEAIQNMLKGIETPEIIELEKVEKQKIYIKITL